MALSKWYIDRSDGIWTIDLDPNFDGDLAVDLNGNYQGVTDVAAQTPVPEDGGSVVISNAVVNVATDELTFAIAGSGALVTFRFTGSGPVRRNDLTLRFRAKET